LSYLKEELCKYDLDNYGTIVLGCTHFSFYKDMFRKLLPANIDIIDGNSGTVKNLKNTLEKINSVDEGSGRITFYNSGIKVDDSDELEKYNELFKRLDKINM
jgi:glutamate racemase